METMPITMTRSLVWQAVQQTIAEDIKKVFLIKKKVQGFLLILALAIGSINLKPMEKIDV
jgi:hypothetical protein